MIRTLNAYEHVAIPCATCLAEGTVSVRTGLDTTTDMVCPACGGIGLTDALQPAARRETDLNEPLFTADLPF